jgi:hypothetical protein
MRLAADVLGTPVCDPNMRRLHASWFVRIARAKIPMNLRNTPGKIGTLA